MRSSNLFLAFIFFWLKRNCRIESLTNYSACGTVAQYICNLSEMNSLLLLFVYWFGILGPPSPLAVAEDTSSRQRWYSGGLYAGAQVLFQSSIDHVAIKGAYRHSLALAAHPKLPHTLTVCLPPTLTHPPPTSTASPFLLKHTKCNNLRPLLITSLRAKLAWCLLWQFSLKLTYL